MATSDAPPDFFKPEDLQVAYVYDPDEDEPRQGRTQKRRRISKKSQREEEDSKLPVLLPRLLNGAEEPQFSQLRQDLFIRTWSAIEQRLNVILRDANSATLDQVSSFVDKAAMESMDRIPSAFIITGPNIASQDLLFEQLSETLQTLDESTPSKFVRLRSPDASTLKNTLKKIIRDATSKASDGSEEDDDLQLKEDQPGRRYLDYDLEGLYAFTKKHGYKHVFVAFQDSEGFDSALLSELIQLLGSWRPRIPFTLLFGIATSVDMLQARLLKSACRTIYGAQFDVVQSGTILETILEKTTMSCSVSLQLGRTLVRGMLDRQQHDMAGIQGFISSLKYSYMCHFFANALSVLPFVKEMGSKLQAEHFQAIRTLPSFRAHVEALVDEGSVDALRRAKSLLESDDVLLEQVQEADGQRQEWMASFLRSLLVVASTGALSEARCKEYVNMSSEGISLSAMPHVVNSVRRMDASQLVTTLHRAVSLLAQGDEEFDLGPATSADDIQLQQALKEQLTRLEDLVTSTNDKGTSLRSKYNGQSKVMRTTVIAQKVQLSQDSASFRDEDRQFTDIVDEVTRLMTCKTPVPPASSVLFSEAWIYDSKSPLRDVFVPRPRAVFERSFTRPHDYLGCSCCRQEDGVMPASWPATPILYRMYLESGNLVNVADLWSAFYATVGEQYNHDERHALVSFYRGLSELRSLGFVKATKKKADHIAKVKWL